MKGKKENISKNYEQKLEKRQKKLYMHAKTSKHGAW